VTSFEDKFGSIDVLRLVRGALETPRSDRPGSVCRQGEFNRL
jgi:hypothetical protein